MYKNLTMAKLQDLKALLIHEVMDVYSAEEQIIESLPNMIESATNPKLKKALQDHLKITRTQKQRLDKVQQLLKVGAEQKGTGKKGGFFGLFGGSGQKCKGTAGIIEEGNSILNEDIDTEVLDAAIIASCQKIEHYEICSYGTLKAYAQELGLPQVVKLLDETLEEEYEADFLLTELAVFGGVNQGAETIEKTANSTAERRAANSRTESRSSSPTGSSSRNSATASRSTGGKASGTKKNSGATNKSSSTKSKSSSSSRKTASVKK
jgi:ferritin-like metal-binding protein YciE